MSCQARALLFFPAVGDHFVAALSGDGHKDHHKGGLKRHLEQGCGPRSESTWHGQDTLAQFQPVSAAKLQRHILRIERLRSAQAASLVEASPETQSAGVVL